MLPNNIITKKAFKNVFMTYQELEPYSDSLKLKVLLAAMVFDNINMIENLKFNEVNSEYIYKVIFRLLRNQDHKGLQNLNKHIEIADIVYMVVENFRNLNSEVMDVVTDILLENENLMSLPIPRVYDAKDEYLDLAEKLIDSRKYII